MACCFGAGPAGVRRQGIVPASAASSFRVQPFCFLTRFTWFLTIAAMPHVGGDSATGL